MKRRMEVREKKNARLTTRELNERGDRIKSRQMNEERGMHKRNIRRKDSHALHMSAYSRARGR